MSKEYIDKSALYEKFAQLEGLARNRYLETPSSSLCHSMYMTQLNERTALKHIIADFPSADVAPMVHAKWDANGRCTNCGCLAPFYCMTSTYHKSHYCFECGAKMDKEEE